MTADFDIGGKSRVRREKGAFAYFNIRPDNRRAVNYGNKASAARFNRLDAFFTRRN